MINRCPISYDEVSSQGVYSPRGLSLLSRKLLSLNALPFTVEEQLFEAARRSGRMSIQGVQPKLSAVLSLKDESFFLVDSGGKYILKPQNSMYPHLPENEDLTMKLARTCGIDVPSHGMVWCKDSTLTYWINRFDRHGRSAKIPLEDFAQLGGYNRSTKYNSSVEKVISIIDTYTTFPEIERTRFFHRFLFDFITGNNDMHLKNYSLITRENRIELSPAYDLLNTTLILPDGDEIALPLNGKKSRIIRKDIMNYLGIERLRLNQNIINRTLNTIEKAIPRWNELISTSFLPENLKTRYMEIIHERLGKMEIRKIIL